MGSFKVMKAFLVAHDTSNWQLSGGRARIGSGFKMCMVFNYSQLLVDNHIRKLVSIFGKKQKWATLS